MSAGFVAHMEGVLDHYAEPHDPAMPVVCFNETSTQLPADITKPLPAKPGRPKRQDYECLRAGTRNLFLSCDPLSWTLRILGGVSERDCNSTAQGSRKFLNISGCGGQ